MATPTAVPALNLPGAETRARRRPGWPKTLLFEELQRPSEEVDAADPLMCTSSDAPVLVRLAASPNVVMRSPDSRPLSAQSRLKSLLRPAVTYRRHRIAGVLLFENDDFAAPDKYRKMSYERADKLAAEGR